MPSSAHHEPQHPIHPCATQADSESIQSVLSPRLTLVTRPCAPQCPISLRLNLSPNEVDLLTRLPLPEPLTALQAARVVSQILEQPLSLKATDLRMAISSHRRALFFAQLASPQELQFAEVSVRRLLKVIGGSTEPEYGSATGLDLVHPNGTILLSAPAGPSIAMQRLADKYAVKVAQVTAEALSQSERSERLSQPRAAYERAYCALQDLQRGLPKLAVSRRLGMTKEKFNQTIKQPWKVDAVPESGMQKGGIHQSRKQDPYISYLIGCIQARIRGPLSHSALELFHPSKQPLLKVAQIIKEYFPLSNATIDRSPYTDSKSGNYRLRVTSRPLARTYNLHTQCGEELPWHLIPTRQEQIAFLNGFATFTGCVGPTSVSFSESSNEQRLAHLAHLFSILDAPPAIQTGEGFGRLFFGDHYSLKKLVELKIFTESSKAVVLERAASTSTERPSLPPSDYFRFIQLRNAHPDLGPAEYGRRTGISPNTIGYWMKGGKPRAINRAELVAELWERHKSSNPEACAILYRDLSLPLRVAKELARVLSADQVRTCMAIAQGFGWNLSADPALFLSIRERYDWLLQDIKGSLNETKSAPLVAHRASIVKWAESLGVTAPSYPALKTALIDFHLPRLDGVAAACFKQLKLKALKVNFDEVRSLIVIRSLAALDTYDPTRGIPFAAFISSFAKRYLLGEFGRATKTGSRVAFIARALHENFPGLVASEVMARFKCSRQTAVAALSFARAGGVLAVSDQKIAQSEEYTIDHIDTHTKGADEIAVSKDLLASVLSDASTEERELIDLHYRVGLSLSEIALRWKVAPLSVADTLKKFLARARYLCAVDE